MKIELDCERNYKNIIDWMTMYKDATNCKGVVLGISGGKDSTVVAMLSKLIWGDNVYGVIMPNGEQKDINDAIDVCELLNLYYTIVNIGDTYTTLLNSIYCFDEDDEEKLSKSKTNIPPRLRMTTLYIIAQTMGYRVIGTGNASERYIGWFTKYGDGGCDLNPIAHLTCTEVIDLGKQLCKEFNLPESLIVKTPADGLTGRSDEDNFGFTYKQLDSYIKGIEDESLTNSVCEKIRNLHNTSKHKLRMPYTMLED